MRITPSSLPISLILFVAIIPILIVYFLEISFAAFLLIIVGPALLVNAGMVGIGAEALFGRVSRWWLLVPLIFYGCYGAVAVHDRITLSSLTAAYDAENARITIPFDPAVHSLAVDDHSGEWLTQNTDLPVAYAANSNFPEGYLSYRVADKAVCDRVRSVRALRAAAINSLGFHNEGVTTAQRFETRFCQLSMPERPTLSLARVSLATENTRVGWLPVRRSTTTVTMPDGKQFHLLGGDAFPLRWLPIPMFGCGVISTRADGKCNASFLRERYWPIVSGEMEYNRDKVVLARALGLNLVTAEDRKGGDPTLVVEKIASVEQAAVKQELAVLDILAANPAEKIQGFEIDDIIHRPDALASRADAIMAALERSATMADRNSATDNGAILARLLASLPRDHFNEFGPRILALYHHADDKHWLWSVAALLGRLGDLGPDALPYLRRAQALALSPDSAVIEGLCRIGPPARAVAEPMLVDFWSKVRDGRERDLPAAIYVAMRRIGGSDRLLVEGRPSQLSLLQSRWPGISPRSPSRVCNIPAERRARDEEKSGGKRLSNLY